MGICGEYNGNKAFVTCGHGLSVGSNITSNGNTIGTISHVQYESWESGDFSIGIRNDFGKPTHRVRGNNNTILMLTNGTCLSPQAGTYVEKYGFASGYAVGEVVSTNITAQNNSGGVVVTNLTAVRLSSGTSLNGDSGGPYWTGNAFCGVHSGSYTDSSGAKICYFTPYSVIANAGFSAYGSHKCSDWVDCGATNHRGYCTICQANVYEEHAKYWDHSIGLCRRCGRTGSITI